MPVYNEHGLIHVHIPKTGGTAIERYFESIGAFKWTAEFWVGQERRNGRWYEYQHLAMQEFRSLTGSTFEAFDSFTVVRNPYARLVSDYIWRRRRPRGPHGAARVFDSFNAFLHAIPTDINTHWLDHVHRAEQSWTNFLIHIRPQYQFVLDAAGSCLVDRVLRFETLDRDMAGFLGRYELSNTTIKRPPARDFESYFDRASLDLVNEIYAKDFECFSYDRL